MGVFIKRIGPLFLVFALVPGISSAQTDGPEFTRHCLYIEGGGQGMLYSINYEYRFREHLGARVGYTNWSLPGFFLFPLIDGRFGFRGSPLMANYFLGGMGTTWSSVSARSWEPQASRVGRSSWGRRSRGLRPGSYLQALWGTGCSRRTAGFCSRSPSRRSQISRNFSRSAA